MRIEKTRAVGWKMPEELHQALLRQANIEKISFSEMLSIVVKSGLTQRKQEVKNDVGSC